MSLLSEQPLKARTTVKKEATDGASRQLTVSVRPSPLRQETPLCGTSEESCPTMNPHLSAFSPLNTKRLKIRALATPDAAAVACLTDDPAITDVVHFLPSPFTVREAEALIASNDDANCFLGVWTQGDLIGVVGIHAHGSDRLEVGYWIGSHFQRQGYATEAVAGVIGQLQRLHPNRQVTAECRTGNEGSWNLLHKLGFRATGQPGDRPGRELLVFHGR